MILNVSGRTDIVAFYTPWFMNRYKEGYLDVRNPFNPKLVSRINFSNVDLILFCTKNPLPIIDRIKEIDKPILFHVTLTPYKKDIEPNVIDKKLVIEGIKKLSGVLGSENVVVRYDPIFLSDSYSLEYHIRAFDKMCKVLKGYVKKVVVSFLDDYKNVRYNMRYLRLRAFTEEKELVDCLRWVSKKLPKKYSLGDIQFLKRGKKKLPIAGIPDSLNTVRPYYYKGELIVEECSAFRMIVNLHDRISLTCHPLGASSNEDDVNYTSQMDMYQKNSYRK